jgi:hypothetical protein
MSNKFITHEWKDRFLAATKEERGKMIQRLAKDMGGNKAFADWILDTFDDEALQHLYDRLRAN